MLDGREIMRAVVGGVVDVTGQTFARAQGAYLRSRASRNPVNKCMILIF